MLTRPENIVHFFRDVHGVGAITKEVLRQRTTEYNQWVEAFARNHHIPIEWAEKGVRKEDYVRPRLRQMERQRPLRGLFHPQEHGGWHQLPGGDAEVSHRRSRTTASSAASARVTPITTSTSATRCWDRSRYASARSCRSRSPTTSTVIISSNSNCAVQGSSSAKTTTPFCGWRTPKPCRPAADALSAKLIRTRLDYWTLIVGPKFSKKDRQAINLGRYYSLQQVEYCRNLIFRRNFPIHKLFERSCDLGLLRLSADRISQVFGWRLHKRLAGKLSSVLERTEHGHHVLRAYAKNAVMRMYEKFSTFLRLEALSNNLKDFGLNKGLDNLDKVRRILGAVTDRFAQFEAQALDVHVDFPLFQRLALPIPRGGGKIPGIKLHDTRMLRLMEVLLHAGTKVLGWRTSDIHQAILSSFGLTPESYTLTQLRYDLRKLKGPRTART